MTLPRVKLSDPVALRGYAHPLRMALIGLLRREGPMTATRAAERLGENVPNCSFHLRQLAKYGLAERAPPATPGNAPGGPRRSSPPGTTPPTTRRCARPRTR